MFFTPSRFYKHVFYSNFHNRIIFKNADFNVFLSNSNGKYNKAIEVLFTIKSSINSILLEFLNNIFENLIQYQCNKTVKM